MALTDYNHPEQTRALQGSDPVRDDNYATLLQWGAYNLLKVTKRGELRTRVSGYITFLQALSGLTPLQMCDLLGLRKGELDNGADIYRLSRVPSRNEFAVRGYTTLVDGLELKPGLKQDSGGYRPGQGAYQIELTTQVEAARIASLGPTTPFEPGINPDLRRRLGYPDPRPA